MDIGEALRYLGAGENPPEDLRCMAEREAAALSAAVRPRYVWRAFDLEKTAAGIRLVGTDVVLAGRMASTLLAQCGQAALLACTLGAAFDTRLRALEARDMARAAVLNACGSALVEEGCDTAEKEISARFPAMFLTDRFSPGYGDLPLEVQPTLCAALDCGRRLGLQVTKSLLMTPVKSVTAIVGLADRPQMARIRGCGYCAMRERCQLRKGGKSCGL